MQRASLLCAIMLSTVSGGAFGQMPPNSSNPAFADGLAAREALETWLSVQTGAYADGIRYWVANCSLKSPKPCEIASADQAFVAGCDAARSRLAQIDFRRRSDTDYRDGFKSYQAAVLPSAPATSSPAPSSSATATYGMIDYGNKAGEEAPITRLIGVGTSRAFVSTTVGPSEATRYCAAQSGGKADQASCIAFYTKENSQSKFLTASVDCTTGDFTDFEGRRLTYAGTRKKDGYVETAIDYEGFELGQYEYIGISTSANQFTKMCPNWTREPPDLPELTLGECNQENAEFAARLTTESGLAHIANLKVIDVWNVKSEDSTWNEVRCKTNVTYNNGKEISINYKLLARHGKYFITVQGLF